MSSKFNMCVLGFCLVILSACTSTNEKNQVDIKPTALIPLDVQRTKVQQLWRESTGEITGDYAAMLSPVIDEGVIYSATEKGSVTALDLETGKILWSYKSSEKISAGMGVDVYHLYVVTNDSKLHALNKKDGRIVWSVALQSSVVAAPSSNNLVLVVHSIDGKVSGFDPHSGNNFWVHQEMVPEITLKGNSRPKFVGGQWVFQGLDNGKIVGLRTQQGGVVFERTININDLKSGSQTTDIDLPLLLVDAGIIVATQRNSLLMISVRTGETIWQGQYDEAIKSINTNQDAVVVVSETDKVFVHEAQTGKLLWVSDELRYRQLNRPAVSASHIYLIDYKGLLHVINLSNAKFDTRVSLNLAQTSNPLMFDGSKLVAIDDQGEIVVYEESLLDKPK